MKTLSNYINGRMVAPENGDYFDNIAPSIGETYSRVPFSKKSDVQNAVEAAQGAFPSWSLKPVERRANWLMLIAKEIRKNAEILAKAESFDQGKTFKAAKFDIERSASFFEVFAKLVCSQSSLSFADQANHIDYVRRLPLGPCALVTPWNFPLSILCWKLAPCLATGNTAVCKPSELSPYSSFLLSQILIDLKLPPGVVNIIHGDGEVTGEVLVSHPKVRGVSFTGSTKTGRRISKLASDRFAKVSLEMGGKNPNIVFSDCNMDEAIETSIRSAFLNQGEICLCGSKILVEQTAYLSFLEKFRKKTEELIVGDPQKDSTFMGALISKTHLEKVLNYVEIARAEGAKILTEPQVINLPDKYRKGYFMRPVIITDLPSESCLNREEIFGPVVSVAPFKNEDEVIEVANSTDFGLSASVWTRDIEKAFRVSERIIAGTVWVNSWMHRNSLAPFGGVKNSGVGREGGEYSLEFFTNLQNISVKY